MNAKAWMSVVGAAVIIPGAIAACAHEKAPVVPPSGGTAYWESELPRDEPSPGRKPAEEAPAPAADTAADGGLPGHSDRFLWEDSTDAGATPRAQEPLRSHDKRLDDRTNTPREPLF